MHPRYIACVGSTASLIVGQFSINGIEATAIVDTGATASFVSGNSDIASSVAKDQLTEAVVVKTADKRCLSTIQTVKATIKPKSKMDKAIILDLYVLPNRNEIMGHEVILGIDAIRAFKLIIGEVNGRIAARVNDVIIAQEFKMLGCLSTDITNSPSPQNRDITTNDKFEATMREFQDIFAENAHTLMNTTPMEIRLSADFSAKAKLRPHSLEDLLEIERQVQQLLDNDIIEPSESEFSANVHLVPKKNGQKRMVVDFRFLNDITRKDHYPLPHLSNMFRALHDAKYFAALDCTEGFLQISVNPNDRYKTAFITDKGSYQYKRAPFGFTNSPAKFQRAMNQIFHDGLFKKCIIYIDDILVFAKTEDELHENVEWVFNCCRDFNVKLKKSKCRFNVPTVEFLGFKISHNAIGPVDGKYDPIAMSQPRRIADVRAILGSYNHYSRFITNYAEKTAPIRKLTQKNVPFLWTRELSDIVMQLKDELYKASAIKITDSESPKYVVILICPNSLEVTCYDYENNLVDRAGTVLLDAEKNYTSVELQMLAIVHAYKKFGPILRGPVTFKTTDKLLLPALKMNQRSPRITRMILQLPPDVHFDIEVVPGRTELEQAISTELPPDEVFYTDGACLRNGRSDCKASWAVLATINRDLSKSGLVDYHRLSNQIAEIYAIIMACEIAHTRGLSNIVIVTDSKYAAGSINKWMTNWKSNNWMDNKGKPVINQDLLKKLSTYIDTLNVKCLHVKGHSTDLNNLQVDQMARNVLITSLHLGPITAQAPTINQEDDEEACQIKNNLEIDPSLGEKYAIVDNQLYYMDQNLPENHRYRLFVPKSHRNMLLRVAHDDPCYGGHLGHKKTKSKLIGYYWPKMGKDIETYIETCTICQEQKASKKPRFGLLQPIQTSQIFEQVHIDIVGPIHQSRTGNKYVITAIDAFSRYGFAKPVPQVRASDIISFLYDEIIKCHGPPKKIASDNGTQFTSREFKEFVSKLDIEHHRTCEYNPQANGMDERLNGTLMKIVRNYVSSHQNDWDEKLQSAIYVYNTSRHESILISPYAALYGFNPRSPLRMPGSDQKAEITAATNRHSQVHSFVASANEKAHEIQKKYYDANKRPQNFNVFDIVKARVHRCPEGLSSKLQAKWESPCVITRIIKSGDQAVAVELINLKTSKRRRSAFKDILPLNERASEDDCLTDLPGNQLLSFANNLAHYTTTEADHSITSDSTSGLTVDDTPIYNPPFNESTDEPTRQFNIGNSDIEGVSNGLNTTTPVLSVLSEPNIRAPITSSPLGRPPQVAVGISCGDSTVDEICLVPIPGNAKGIVTFEQVGSEASIENDRGPESNDSNSTIAGDVSGDRDVVIIGDANVVSNTKDTIGAHSCGDEHVSTAGVTARLSEDSPPKCSPAIRGAPITLNSADTVDNIIDINNCNINEREPSADHNSGGNIATSGTSTNLVNTARLECGESGGRNVTAQAGTASQNSQKESGGVMRTRSTRKSKAPDRYQA